MGAQALQGIKVLDLTRLLPGPYCSMILADFGAEVIKVEQPGEGDYARWYSPMKNGMGYRHIMLNRNKKSITIDLKTTQGKEIFLKLAKNADVIMEGFRPGAMKRLGLDYDSISQINPQIIFCSLSGFGQTGPYKFEAAHDLNYISIAGITSLTGEKNGKPHIPGIQISDISGGFTAAIGILLAVNARHHTGKGQYVDTSLFNAALATLPVEACLYFGSGDVTLRGESALTGGIPNYNIYRTKDDRYLAVAALENKFWVNFCKAIDREDFIDGDSINEDLSMDESKAEQRNMIFKKLEELFSTKTLKEWEKVFARKNACVSPVKNIDETFDDPHVKANEMVVELTDAKLGKHLQLGFPFKLSDTPGTFARRAPELGEHNQEILQQLGYSEGEISGLKSAKII